MNKGIDFGAPSEFGKHHFYVDIPPSSREAVSIFEDYGFDGDESLRETSECRVILARELWTKIKDEARKDFNLRLKTQKQSTGTWKTGKVKLDRFLGKELCVLAWAAEHASPSECSIISAKWLALRPEERWWFYTKTASEARLHDQKQRGWRKALYCALSDATNIRLAPQTKPKLNKKKIQKSNNPSIFDLLPKGN